MKRFLAILLLSAIAFSATLPVSAAICSNTSTGLTPLTQLGAANYLGFQGGLYPGGSNVRPTAHEAAGIIQSFGVRPRNAKGLIVPHGKIVLLSIGMSNTTQEFSTFIGMANADPLKNPKLILVDGAQGGMSADRIYDLTTATAQSYWDGNVAGRLQQAGVTPKQVQAVWMKLADALPLTTFPAHANQLKTELTAIAQILRARFPNLKQVYVSSRIYGGYADSPATRGEPLTYETGFSAKWLIEDQINGAPELNFQPRNGEVRSAWLSWGPYLWADGMTPRSDGLFYQCSDFQSDGIHPAVNGAREKVAGQLLDFFKTDSASRRWFLRNP